MKYLFDSVMDVVMPRKCIVCGERLLAREKHLCLYCENDIPLTYNWICEHNQMADRYNAMIQKDMPESCDCCGASRHICYEYAASLFRYDADSAYRHICHNLKYGGNIPAGKYFGKMLGEKLAQSELYRNVGAIVPVPLHWMRKWSRGYNQAEIIAARIALCLGAGLYPRMLVRTRMTKTQTKLDVGQKSSNVSGAFDVRMSYVNSLKDKNIRHILIVDDVFTTGATAVACYHALRKVFSPDVRISAVTLAAVM